MRIFVIQGSPRHQDNCPGEWSKTLDLILKVLVPFAQLGRAKFDYLDLAVAPDSPPVRPCKGCASTANGYHCHWYCSCYGPRAFAESARTQSDLMHDLRVYQRMEAADAFILFSPVHWYGVTTNVKAMFDRLVCANMTLTQDQAELYGLMKDKAKTVPAEREQRYDNLLRNHLAGRIGAFFVHGDGGANDYSQRRPPPSYLAHRGSPSEPDDLAAIMPIVWQCRWSGIEVPDDLVVASTIGKGLPYSENRINDAMIGAATGLVNKVISLLETRAHAGVDAQAVAMKQHVPASPANFRALPVGTELRTDSGHIATKTDADEWDLHLAKEQSLGLPAWQHVRSGDVTRIGERWYRTK